MRAFQRIAIVALFLLVFVPAALAKIEQGYLHEAKIYFPKPYPSIGGARLALEQTGEKNPAARTARPEQFMDVSLVKELDESGYIDRLYR